MSVAIDSSIYTLRGLAPAARILAPVFCFAWRDGRITVGQVRGRIGPRKPMVRVLLDDGTALRVSIDQEFVRRDGSLVRAGSLAGGDRLMPLYVSFTTNGYPLFRHVSNHFKDAPCPIDRKRRRLVSRMVCEWRVGGRLQPGVKVWHLDRDRRNCDPSNLDLRYARNRGSALVPRIKAVAQANKFADAAWDLIAKHRRERLRPSPDNHRVKSVDEADEEPVLVLDSTLEGCFNVGVGGVFLAVKEGTYGVEG